MNTVNHEIQKVLREIELTGNTVSPRNLKVKEKHLVNLEIDPEYSLPEFSSRKMNYKYLLGELAWYLKRDTKTDFINQFSSFWKNLENQVGEIHSNYGDRLFGKQLQWAKDCLIKDPYTRQAISFISGTDVQYANNKDFICTMYLNFWIRDNKLYMKAQLRSQDCFYGAWYDIPFFSFIHQTMRFWLSDIYKNLQLGTYYHCADNIHYYEKHFEVANNILNESIYNNKKFVLKAPLFRLENQNMILTQEGNDFFREFENLDIASLSQKDSKEILLKYFKI